MYIPFVTILRHVSWYFFLKIDVIPNYFSTSIQICLAGMGLEDQGVLLLMGLWWYLITAEVLWSDGEKPFVSAASSSSGRAWTLWTVWCSTYFPCCDIFWCNRTALKQFYGAEPAPSLTTRSRQQPLRCKAPSWIFVI